MAGYNFKSLSISDVTVGQQLPEFHMPITIEKCVMAASAARDWQPQHHDRDYSQKQGGFRDMFIGMWFYMGIVTRYVTDWAGPESFVTSLKYKMRESICPGDDMKIEAKVTGKREEDGKQLVELDVLVSNQLGPTTPATVIVELPAKAAN